LPCRWKFYGQTAARMKKRHPIKQYGPAAVILLFLLIWLGQQNTADNSMMNTIPIEQRPAGYDVPHRRDIDIDLTDDRGNMRDLQETKRQTVKSSEYHSSSRNASRSNASVATRIIFNIKQKEQRLRPSDQISKNHTEAGFVHDEKSVKNFVKGVSNEGVEHLSPPVKEDDLGKLNRQRRTDVGVMNSSVHRHETSTAANIVDDRKTVAVNSTVEYVQRRPLKQPAFNDSFVISGEEPHLKPSITTVKRPQQQDLSDVNDEYKRDSLILARQMALKNFEVITDNKERSHVEQSANNGVSSNVGNPDLVPIKDRTLFNKQLFENIVRNSSVDRGRKQEIDELRMFADVPTLPKYDLPMLKDKSADAKRATSKVLPSQLVSGKILATVSNLVVNSTLDDDGGGGLKFDDEVLADTDDVMSNAVVLGEVNSNK